MDVFIKTIIQQFLYTDQKLPFTSQSLSIGKDLEAPTSADFEVEVVKFDTIAINTNTFAAFTCNIFDYFNFPKNQATFVHIGYFKNIDKPQPISLRFQLSIDGVALGKMSQFTLANLSNFNSAILIDDLDSPTGLNGYLFIIIGGKTA